MKRTALGIPAVAQIKRRSGHIHAGENAREALPLRIGASHAGIVHLIEPLEPDTGLLFLLFAGLKFLGGKFLL